jgi:hypothetical protein
MTDNFAAIVALGIGLASPVLIWSITRPRTDTLSDRARLFGGVFLVTAAALVFTRFAVIPLLRWLDVTLF